MSRALLLVDHGSRREEATSHVEWIAEQVRSRRPDLSVYVAHMELAAPSIADAIERCVDDGVRELVIHPLFLVPGRHLSEDLPRLVEAAASQHPRLRVRITQALGLNPELAELILASLA